MPESNVPGPHAQAMAILTAQVSGLDSIADEIMREAAENGQDLTLAMARLLGELVRITRRELGEDAVVGMLSEVGLTPQQIAELLASLDSEPPG